MSALAMQPQECPRVVGPSADGKRLLTCGELVPCPIHGMPLFVIANPPTAGAAE